jgi:hypothetical protein
MTAAERNYDTHDGELLTIIEAFKAWRHYLEGSQHKIEIHTDHKNLCRFLSTKHLTQRQVRWAEWLAPFWIEILHRKGASNPADGLSRRPDYEEPDRTTPARADLTNQRILQRLQNQIDGKAERYPTHLMGNAVLDTDPLIPCRYPQVMTTLEESGTDRSLLDCISDAYPTDPRAQQVVMSMGAPREEQPD